MTISIERAVRVGALVCSLWAVAVASPLAAQERPRLLVVNDDGADATGLKELVRHLSEIAEVVVAAPDQDRSWAGRSKTIPSGMLRLREIHMEGAIAAYAIEGTPVDEVHFGLEAIGVEEPFDAVIAGVNFGITLGFEAYNTGVVGAALEAAALGVPAIAVAQDRRAHLFDVAAGVTKQLLAGWLENGLEPGIALSVNVPASAADHPRGIVVARLGSPEYEVTGFRKVESDDPRQMWRIQFKKVRRPERETDLDWYQRGEIIVSPIRADSSAESLIETVEGWGLEAPTRELSPGPSPAP